MLGEELPREPSSESVWLQVDNALRLLRKERCRRRNDVVGMPTVIDENVPGSCRIISRDVGRRRR